MGTLQETTVIGLSVSFNGGNVMLAVMPHVGWLVCDMQREFGACLYAKT